jgi:hypothetical protein
MFFNVNQGLYGAGNDEGRDPGNSRDSPVEASCRDLPLTPVGLRERTLRRARRG